MDKGISTSEFWLTLSFAALIVLNGTRYVEIPWEQIIAYATLALGYTGGRTLKKTAEVKATADLSALAARVKRELG